jgi:WD40 repeat protein
LHGFFSLQDWRVLWKEGPMGSVARLASILSLLLIAAPRLAAQEAKERAILKGHIAFVSSLAFSPDGKTLLSGSNDQTVKLWDVTSGKLVRTLEGHVETVYSVAMSADGKKVIAATLNEVRLWDVATGKQLSGPNDKVRRLAFPVGFFPDGQHYFTGLGNGVGVWEAGTNRPLAEFRGDVADAGLVAVWGITKDGRRLASTHPGGTLRVWDFPELTKTDTFKEVAKIAKVFGSVAFSADAKVLAAPNGLHGRTIKVWEAATGKELASFEVGADVSVRAGGYVPGGGALAFVPGTRTLAIVVETKDREKEKGSSARVELWDTSTGKKSASLKGLPHGGGTYGIVAFSPDCRTLALGDEAFAIKIWDISSIIHAKEKR